MAVYIGTSGFSYHHWVNKFYPDDLEEKKWLEYYSRYFNTVEINSSFYRLPQEKIFKTWRERTPDDFAFAVKGSKYITHTKRLLVGRDSVDLFMKRTKKLGPKLQVVLWQFPPRFKSDIIRLEDFLKILVRYKCRFAFEFREESWFNDEIYLLLKKYNMALVIADSPEFPKFEIKTADFSYIRFHGGKYLYSSKYAPQEMKEWSQRIEKMSKYGDVYAYFNNDANAFAVKDAFELKKLSSE